MPSGARPRGGVPAAAGALAGAGALDGHNVNAAPQTKVKSI
ncbi:hypothetical protein HMPREF1550_00160 [Actinomyces sp. oral taxon 877 str. F0543]|nr:hypothetical protein HMPREF1550_00160 [Actinomyces sp. oral taxon 877 str. F0543]